MRKIAGESGRGGDAEDLAMPGILREIGHCLSGTGVIVRRNAQGICLKLPAGASTATISIRSYSSSQEGEIVEVTARQRVNRDDAEVRRRLIRQNRQLLTGRLEFRYGEIVMIDAVPMCGELLPVQYLVHRVWLTVLRFRESVAFITNIPWGSRCERCCRGGCDETSEDKA